MDFFCIHKIFHLLKLYLNNRLLVLFHYLDAFILFLKGGNFGSFDTIGHSKVKTNQNNISNRYKLVLVSCGQHSFGDNFNVNRTVSNKIVWFKNITFILIHQCHKVYSNNETHYCKRKNI